MIIKLSTKEKEALHFIRNSIVHKGKSPSIREIMDELSFKSPRSAAIILSKLMQKELVGRKANGSLFLKKQIIQGEQTIDVPLIGSVACGMPLLAEENVDSVYPVSIDLARKPFSYFLLRAKGDSMNLGGINDGDIVLVRQQNVARNGQQVVALINDEATIKELHMEKDFAILKPLSNNPDHKPIILKENFDIQGTVIATIPNL